MKTLLHICCGPCSIYPLEWLRTEGHGVQGYFFNPNIHPYTEYLKRRETLEAYAAQVDLPLIVAKDYRLEDYFRHVAYREAERCRLCYTLRLRQAAGVARRGKFDAFTTTLLVSPFQKHDLIRAVGEAAGREFGVAFLYHDFREGFKEATQRSRDLGMYRQQYCGCLFSEYERYAPGRKKDKGGR
ncbi:MAG: epoxyqueuosine reductase QueH [Bacillota bacterium]|nr:epoxyqueuosine reductase QueH [Bacillota bacterium]